MDNRQTDRETDLDKRINIHTQEDRYTVITIDEQRNRDLSKIYI